LWCRSLTIVPISAGAVIVAARPPAVYALRCVANECRHRLRRVTVADGRRRLLNRTVGGAGLTSALGDFS
jgi:hypothetical protein